MTVTEELLKNNEAYDVRTGRLSEVV